MPETARRSAESTACFSCSRNSPARARFACGMAGGGAWPAATAVVTTRTARALVKGPRICWCYFYSTCVMVVAPMGTARDRALTRRERQIMDILYRRGRATAAEVMDELTGSPNYSTVRTQLRVLEDKGQVR